MQTPEQKTLLQRFTGSHKGKKLDPKQMLRPNTMIAKVLTARLMSMTPEQQAAIKSILTPQTIPALSVLLPELKDVMTKGQTTGAPNAG